MAKKKFPLYKPKLATCERAFGAATEELFNLHAMRQYDGQGKDIEFQVDVIRNIKRIKIEVTNTVRGIHG